MQKLARYPKLAGHRQNAFRRLQHA
jgi:hypothetical protein